MPKLKPLMPWLLFAVIILASLLRLYNLAWSDVINDEVIFAFRSIGYIDFFSSPYQTTPYEWFSSVPWWAKLSFHDHPPLVFFVQYIFFKVFGENVIALRLPFALAGIGSVILLYFIGQELFNKRAGLIAGALLAVSSYHVWVSRTGLQEAVVIFFMLLAFYFFVRSQKTNKHWQWAIALGLAMLAKYTSFVLIPVFGIYFLLFKRSVFKDKKFWLALILILLVFSPVIIYNLKLYQARGHFDLQFSYLFNQKVGEWEFLPGKIQAGAFTDRLKNLVPAFYNGMLWPMFILFVISFVFGIYEIIKKIPRLEADRRSGNFDFFTKNQSLFLLILAIIFHLLLFLVIGPSKRFVVAVVPFAILLISWFIGDVEREKQKVKDFLLPSRGAKKGLIPRPATAGLRKKWAELVPQSISFIAGQKKAVRIFLVGAVVAIEIFFSYNTLFTYKPIGKQGIAYSYLWVENYNWGYNQLDDYLEDLLKDKRPAVQFATRYLFLEEIKNKALRKAESQGRQASAVLLIYDYDMYDLATFWLFHRRLVYQGWPIITSDDYLAQGEDFWQSQGIEDFYFFKIIDPKMLLRPPEEKSDSSHVLQKELSGLTPEIIKRPDGREVFAVYYWQNHNE